MFFIPADVAVGKSSGGSSVDAGVLIGMGEAAADANGSFASGASAGIGSGPARPASFPASLATEVSDSLGAGLLSDFVPARLSSPGLAVVGFVAVYVGVFRFIGAAETGGDATGGGADLQPQQLPNGHFPVVQQPTDMTMTASNQFLDGIGAPPFRVFAAA
jgi:hypothetical protein